MYDIAIIGLGPGGSTLARLIGPQYKVIALDKKAREGEGGFHKPCGGLLAGDAQKALARFGLTLPKDVLVDPQIFAVRTLDTKQHLLRHYQRFYINLDRHKFDRWLISLIPDRVTIEQAATCTDIRPADGGYLITYYQAGQVHHVRARYVVGADGAASIVRKLRFPHRPIRRYLAIQQWFAQQGSSPFYACVFDPDITDSYGWSLSKDGHCIIGGAFPVDGARARLERLKDTLRQEQGFCFGEAVRTEACLVNMPRTLRDFCTGDENAFLVGEAAGFISPSSLEGISYAMDSAYHLSAALNAGRADIGRAYRARTLPTRLRLMAKRLKSPFMYHPFLRRCVMQSGLMAVRMAGGPIAPFQREQPPKPG